MSLEWCRLFGGGCKVGLRELRMYTNSPGAPSGRMGVGWV